MIILITLTEKQGKEEHDSSKAILTGTEKKNQRHMENN